ncbi:MAG: T9SS type A sorting domain-containing protein [bacterium]
MRRPKVLVILFTFAISLALQYSAQATAYWTTADFARFTATESERLLEQRMTIAPRFVDDYALLFEYVQICDFLVQMQELDPFSDDYGGMHEGESPDLWAIVESDNTQEAIRVWSTYAELSGDLATYQGNVAAAWVYTMNHPAYNEEGSDSDYYRVHNCGWALVAEEKYRQVYSDTTYLWYADSCAQYIQIHDLPMTGVSDYYARLHPLVKGWAAGSLYDYGVQHGDSSANAAALAMGAEVQTWIAASPARLANNEIWAMSGGTALWGVCRSVFAANPTSGQSWLPQYLPYMDTYAGPGAWNNSWNVWYAHAYHAAAAVLQDSLYTGYAMALVDTLLDADVDDDGGIMATSTDPPTEDQSWVSCYLDYMGIAPYINQLPLLDAAVLGFNQPDLLFPIAQGQPQEVSIIVGNTGSMAFSNVNVILSGAFSASGSTFLEFADVDTPFIGYWTPAEPGLVQLIATLSPGGTVVQNDTLSLWVPVLGWGEISGVVTDLSTGAPLAAELLFYYQDYPATEPLYTTNADPATGAYAIPAIEGSYRVVVDPQIPYTDREKDDVVVLLNEMAVVDFALTPATVVLVDDDGGLSFEEYYLTPLANANYDVYHWDADAAGAIQEELQLFNAAIWFTGNETENTLGSSERTALGDFLANGGQLLITGQNIAADLTAEPFLLETLGVAFVQPSSGYYQVQGVAGDPVTEGLSLILVGSGGANNQNSMDVIQSAVSGLEAMHYAFGTQPCAAVRVDSVYKSLFLAFGLEAASGAGGTATRQQFLTAVMEWFQIPTSVKAEPTVSIPIEYPIISLYPNPFNAKVRIAVALPITDRTVLYVYDLLGKKVADIAIKLSLKGLSCIDFTLPENCSSGIYLFVVKTEKRTEVAKGIFLK